MKDIHCKFQRNIGRSSFVSTELKLDSWWPTVVNNVIKLHSLLAIFCWKNFWCNQFQTTCENGY